MTDHADASGTQGDELEKANAGYLGSDRRVTPLGTRRLTDKFCTAHDILWEHHDKETTEHRENVCTKLGQLSLDIKAMTPKWVFVLVMSASFGFSLILFTLVAASLKDSQSDIKSSLSEIKTNMAQKTKDEEAARISLMDLHYSLKSIDSRLSVLERQINNDKGR